MDSIRQVPAAALHFDAAVPLALAAADSTDAPRTFAGVAYSGDAIRDHFFWGNVVFDLTSTTAPERVPVLIEHDRGQRAGVGQLTIDKDIRIDGTLLANASGRAVASDADAGFPWQLSVHIEPGSVEEVAPGVQASVNGRAFTGPLTIFRNSLIRETSFTPTGADAQTHARVFASAPMRAIPVFSAAPAAPAEDSLMSDPADTQRIAALESDLSTAKAAITAANERADAAEAALAGIKASARVEQVKTLFAALGRTYDEAAAKPYLQIDDEAFATVAADLKAAAPKPAPHLFGDTATDGAHPEAATLDFSAIYDARKRKGE